jgi:hypothetical protein
VYSCSPGSCQTRYNRSTERDGAGYGSKDLDGVVCCESWDGSPMRSGATKLSAIHGGSPLKERSMWTMSTGQTSRNALKRHNVMVAVPGALAKG